MSTVESHDVADVLNRVKDWSPSLRITLARQIPESVERQPVVERPPMLIPLDQVYGMLKTDAPPPTDEECERIIEEERMRKFG